MPPRPDPETGGLPPHAPLTEYYASEAERRRLVDSLFDRTARYYERVNAFTSFGTGTRYRREALVRAGLRAGMRVLDVGMGTGPLARAAREVLGPSGRLVGIDPSHGMLTEALATLPIPVVQGLGEQLPFQDATFDFLSMGYALRHVGDLREAFAEYHRVLGPGGRLLILDLARPRRRAAYRLAWLYLGRVVPWVAGVGSRNPEVRRLMRYCWDTIDRSVPPETVEAAMTACGFRLVRRAVLFGVLAEYAAVKPHHYVRVTAWGDVRERQ